MADKLASHQDIEEVFKATHDLVATRIPDSIESREARRILDVAEKLTYQARERGKREAE